MKMGETMYVLGLFFIASIISSFAAELSKYKNIQKSSLILEYNWPEPSKSLNRLPHPRSCHHFIHTKHDGSHVVKRCHGDKIFDYRSLRCQHKSSAKCWMNIVKKGNIKKIKTPFSCPFPWGLYPDKEDCTFFYNCMGGKVYPRKCPDSTLFDVAERICVHSRKALCARDSDIITPSDRSISELPKRIATTIPSMSSGTFGIDSKERNSEEIDKKNRKKSKNKLVTSKFSGTNVKSFRSADSEEDSSEEKNSSEKKHSTKSKNKFTTSKLLLRSTSTVNPKLFKKTNSDFQENSSEEEENSSEERDNKIRPKYKLKFTTSKIQTSPNINHKKENSAGILPISTNMFTEKKRITPSSKDGHFSESPFQSTAIKPLVSTENKQKPFVNTMTPGISDKDVDDIHGDTERVFWSTETMSKEFISSVVSHDNLKLVLTTVSPEGGEKDDDKKDDITTVSQHPEITSMEHISSANAFSHEKTDTTSNIPFISGSSTIRPLTTENIDTEITSEGSFSFSCPEQDGHFPHPTNKNLFVVCSGGHPIIMKCPKGLVFDSHSTSCNYDEFF